MKFAILALATVLCFHGIKCYTLQFHDSFSFGTATAAYQIEGAWNEDGKGVSLWDHITHNMPIIVDGSNGDIACDSYHKMDEDIALLKSMGVNHYRFSISWTRILPTGLINDINPKGLAYYDELINKLLAAGIEPWVTIYHWDHPYSIELMGGWFQSEIADYIADFSDLLFKSYGDRVKTWITINEPYSICVNYMPIYGQLRLSGTIEYVCGINLLRAHAAIAKVYRTKYKWLQGGKLSMAFSLQGYIPATNSQADIDAADRINQFALGWFVHPVIFGDYPPIMKKVVAEYSKQQGFKSSRLPALTLAELIDMKGSIDFIGLNNYETFFVSADNGTANVKPSWANDRGATLQPNTGWNSSYSIQMKAYGFGEILKWIQKTYWNPEIRILEQGLPDNGTLLDHDRHEYLVANMAVLLECIQEHNVRVTGYTFWSLMDNFEWTFGYTVRYGLNHIDFSDPARPRTPKISAGTFTTIAKTKSIASFV